MSDNDRPNELSVWAGHDKDAPAHLVSATPPRPLKVNGAPITEQSHEHVLKKKPNPNARN